MKLVTAQEMRKIDQESIEEIGIPGVVLMENAGRAVANTALELLKNRSSKTQILILAGTGNNGGDALVVARLLYNLGLQVQVFLIGKSGELSGEARINLYILRKMGLQVEELRSEEDLNYFQSYLQVVDLIVDGILGTGIEGEVRGLLPQLIKILNQGQLPIVAIDIPSGLDADTGRPCGIALKATKTVTLGLPKLGLMLYPGRNYLGELEIADISLPQRVIANQDLKHNLITNSLARKLLPVRARDGHKGSFGKVLVVAGSPGMTGAATLCSQATLKSGAGVVTLALPASLSTLLELKLTEVMTRPLAETGEGTLSAKAAGEIMELSLGMDVMAIGPGLAQNREINKLLKKLLVELELPLVIDADGLNGIQDLDLLRKREAVSVLTPHPGELARLLDISITEIQERRVEIARDTAQDLGVVLVLKGAATVVALPGGSIYINSTGNSGLASAGSGDVLTGVISALMAQGLEAAQGAILGVFLHGLAGDLALKKETTYTLLASNLIQSLPQAFKYLKER